jgi:hypothetical protein
MPENIVEMDVNEFMKLWNTFKAGPSDSLTLMVCVVVDGAMQVQPIARIGDLFTFPDQTLVVAQRRTGSNSKFAEFTVGQLRAQMGKIST